MKYYTKQHKYTCGIDLHARILHICILDSDGNIVFHKSCKANPTQLLNAIKPFMDNLVIGVECMFSWYWVADFCEKHGIKFILGHALYMKAIHGGKAKNDKIDSEKIARLIKAAMFPQAYVYPAKMRGTRDLMRRRMKLMHDRAEKFSHVQNTLTQYNLPPNVSDLKVTKYHERLKDTFSDACVQRSVDLDLTRIAFYNQELSKLEYYLKKTARDADPQSIAILQSVHGIGNILSLVIYYEIHTIERFKSVQDFASYSRVVKCKRESAGKSYGTGGNKIGNAYLRWAFGEAALLFLRANPEAQKWLEAKSNKHNKAKALTLLSHKLARAVYYMLKRKTFFDQEKFLANS